MTFHPTVSIIIPVFNGADFLKEAIESALAQTYQSFEVLVINDGSNDHGKTERIAQAFGTQIRYFKKDNGGVASALNVGLKNMTGTYFSWLSHDDLYVPDKLSHQVTFLSTLPLAKRQQTILYGDWAVFTTNSKITSPNLMRKVPSEGFRYWLTYESTMHGCTLLIPRESLLSSGGFDENLRTTQDYDLWFRLAKNHVFIHQPCCLVKGRHHPEQGTLKLPAIVRTEGDALLSSFVKTLSTHDVLLATGQTLPVAYAYLAASLWRRGFTKAGRLAVQRLFQTIHKASIIHQLLALIILFRGLILSVAIKSLKKYVPFSLFRKLRAKFLHHQV